MAFGTETDELHELKHTQRWLDPLALGAFGIQVWAFATIIKGSERYGTAFMIAVVALAANAWAYQLGTEVRRRRRSTRSTRADG